MFYDDFYFRMMNKSLFKQEKRLPFFKKDINAKMKE
jgi:hypothetical protein